MSVETKVAQALDHVQKGDKATDAAVEHYIAAGKLLAQIKDEVGHGKWLTYCQQNISELKQSRIKQLIAIGKGGEAELKRQRANNSAGACRFRDKTKSWPLRNGDTEKSEARAKADQAQAEAQKAKAEAQKAKAEEAAAKHRANEARAKAKAEAQRREAEFRERMFRMTNGGDKPTIHRSDRERLVKTLGMLGSDHAGERDNAARQAERLRRQLGMSWDDLIVMAARTAKAA
jgi:pyruvate/2-oxoglutarate dehydrogenase complex dihydrolipoamide acyltransferase (E2) component